MSSNLKQVRDRILEERGITTVRRDVSKHRKLEHVVTAVPDHFKTPHMLYLEMKYHKDIVTILTSGSTRHIEKTYGIDHTTASRWRSKLAGLMLKEIS